MELARFIFQDFWHWLGAFLLLALVAQGITNIFHSLNSNYYGDPGIEE